MRGMWLLAAGVGLLLASAALAGPQTIVGTAGSKQPQSAISAQGTTYLVYGTNSGSQGTIYVTSSRDGTEYAAPKKVAEVESLMLGMRRGPRIAATKSAVIVSAIGKVGDILCWRSEDNGEHWTPAATINDAPGAAREGLFNLAAGPEDRLFAVWLDLRDKATRIYGANSDDGGKTWAKNVLIYQSPDGHVCECCHPSVAFDAQGSIHIMFRNWLAGSRDMYLTSSNDGGKTFSAAQKLGEGTWSLNACPMDGGAVAANGNALPITVWRRTQTVYLDEPGKKELEISAGRQPTIAIRGDQRWIAWESRGAIQLRQPNGETTDLGKGSFPAFATSTSGGPVVLLWESPEGITAMRADK